MSAGPRPSGWTEDRFVPCTRAISVGAGVVYRPLRSWHSGVFAGERLDIVNGDRSGCVIKSQYCRDGVAPIPYTYTHRLYWNAEGRTVSAFLSYPNGMGCSESYFWEAMLEDVERFWSEEEMEDAVRAALRVEGGEP